MADPLAVAGYGISPRLLLKVKRRVLKEENAKWPWTMTPVPRETWPMDVLALGSAVPEGVWRSREYLAVLYVEPSKPQRRLSVCRAAMGGDGRFSDGLTWDQLQQIKRECGFGDCEAVEMYPRDQDVVNVANMRHLWLVTEPCSFAWRKNDA